MFHICSAGRTVDSKIDENRFKQKNELIQVMCILYRYITSTASNCSISLTVIYPFQWKKYNVVQSDYFASVRAICGVTDFFKLCHTCICMGRIKEGDII